MRELPHDPWAWLRERSDPRVLEHLRAENERTAAAMAHTADLQRRLYDEMLGRIEETDAGVPERVGDYLYYWRTEKGRPYRLHCRKRGSLDAAEELLIDENELAAGKSYFRLGAARVSDDHRRLAYAIDTEGDERYTLRVLDLASGTLLEDEIHGVHEAAEWSADGRSLFYTVLDAAHRPFRALRHDLGADPSSDAIVLEEPDEAFFLGLCRTKDRRFVVVGLHSNTTSEAWLIDREQPAAPLRPVWRRRHRIEYAVEHRAGWLYLLTNDDAVNFRIVRVPLDDPAGERHDVVPHVPEIKLDDFDLFRGHLVSVERRGGMRGLRVVDLDAGGEHVVELPEPVHTVDTTANPEFDSAIVRFAYSSPVTPESVFDYDMRTRERVLRKQQAVLGGFDASRYRTERVFVRAPDGVQVPMSIVFREGLVRDGSSPAVLYGYGAYGLTSEPGFDSRRLSLLDRGVVWAIAHVRGGGELGRPWYEDGKQLRKRNTFTDFVACAERLIADGWTSPERLAIRGGSAGGLLVGATLNLRPDLFRAAVARVPFVDVVRTLLDASLPLTVTEWEEWGDPRNPEFFDYIASYSPCDNVSRKDYPDVLITGGLTDPRVAYWEPAKWAARLRESSTRASLVLLKMDLEAGHGGPSGRYAQLQDLAFEYAFLLDRLGVRS